MQPASRYGFLDLYRGIIVLFMLQGHFVREVLAPEWRGSGWFALHELFHGMTAPGFIFSAGFAFAIATVRKGTVLRGFNGQVLRRMWRAITLILVGYALHIPFLSLTKTLSSATSSQWNEFLRFDVLQLIGLGLVALRCLYMFFRDDAHFLAVVGVLAILIAAGTPLVWSSSSIASMPLWLSQAFCGLNGSPFPVFPYAAYLFAGTVVSWGFVRSRQADQERRFVMIMLIAGVVMVPAGLVLHALLDPVIPQSEVWMTSPGYVVLNLGLLLVSLAGLWVLESFFADTPAARWWMPNWLTTLGVESLFVYIAHLILLYGWVVNPDLNLQTFIGTTLSPASAFLLSLIFILVLVPLAPVWHRLKKQHAPVMNLVYWWIGLSVAGEFLLRPY